MRLFLVLVYLVLLPCSLSSRSVPYGFADLVKELTPAVVNISTEQKILTTENKGNISPNFPQGHLFEEFKHFFDRFSPFFEEENTERDIVSLGSGFVIDKDGLIVTNRHVIASQDGNMAKNITITFHDNLQLKAKVLAVDIWTDLAVLKVEPERELKYVKFADSDEARVGDWLIAIGNSFGLGGSVTAGILSARGRDINIGQQQSSDFIQTDAAINRGNSGGPLFNSNGEVVGINTAIISPSGGNIGIGFAIPSNIAVPVIEHLAKGKQVERGWIGVKVQAVTQEISDSIGQKSPHGALVVEVTDGSPAQKAGIEVGDVITDFNGSKIMQMRNLLALVARTKIDSIVDISVMRNSSSKKQNITLKLKIKKLEDAVNNFSPISNTKEYESFGIKVTNLSREIRERYNIKQSVKGILVLDVNRNYNRVLRPGDIILKIDGNYIENLEQFNEIIESQHKKKNPSVLLLINRQGDNLFIGMKIAK